MRTSKTVMAQLGAVDIFTHTYLVTGGAAWLERLGVVTPAVDVVVLVEVDEVDEELLARDADEAGGVPADAGARALRHHRHVAALDRLRALQQPGAALTHTHTAGRNDGSQRATWR